MPKITKSPETGTADFDDAVGMEEAGMLAPGDPRGLNTPSPTTKASASAAVERTDWARRDYSSGRRPK